MGYLQCFYMIFPLYLKEFINVDDYANEIFY